MKYIYALLIAITATGTVQAADYAAGATLGTNGLGLNFSLKNDFQLRGNDQFQTRFGLSGGAVDDADDLDISNNDYKGDLSATSLRGTVDWFPFQGFAKKVFFSAGLDYTNAEADLQSEANQTLRIGDTRYAASDNIQLDLDVDSNPVSPYLGVGWGNRIGDDSGFSFLAELGVLIPLSDPDVKLSATDPNNRLAAADLAKEKKQIEDDLSGAQAVAMLGVTYHF